MELIEMIGISAFIIFVYMTFMFLLAIIVKDNSIADVAWGIGFIAVSLATLLIGGDFAPRKVLVTGLVLIWGLRLAIRIFMRNWGKGEDWRYRKWRENWGRYFILRSYLQVFMLQGCILLLNVSPVLAINTYGSGQLIWIDAIGILVWGLGFFFESVGDYQLDRFIEIPRIGERLWTGVCGGTRAIPITSVRSPCGGESLSLHWQCPGGGSELSVPWLSP